MVKLRTIPESIPPYYHGIIQAALRDRHNRLVLSLRNRNGVVEPYPFSFDGNSLDYSTSLRRKFPSKVLLRAQKIGWDMFPSDSFGNTVFHTTKGRILSNGCIVYGSDGADLMECDGSTVVNSEEFEGKGSPKLEVVQSYLCKSFNSPGSSFDSSKRATATSSPHFLSDGSRKVEALGGQKVRFGEDSSVIFADHCSEVDFLGCNNLKATNCHRTTFKGTSQKEFTGLKKRTVINGEVQLFWYEALKRWIFRK